MTVIDRLRDLRVAVNEHKIGLEVLVAMIECLAKRTDCPSDVTTVLTEIVKTGNLLINSVDSVESAVIETMVELATDGTIDK